MRLPDIPDHLITPADLTAATAVQRELAQRVRQTPLTGPVRLVAGLDVSCRPRDPRAPITAAAVLIDVESLTPVAAPVATATATVMPRFPYVPGYLAFREAPALLAALAGLPEAPDLILVDGQGIAHPRGLGIASFVGVLLNLPTIGIGKTLLTGKPDGSVGPLRGDWAFLRHQGRVVGCSLRSSARANPIHVSVGHAIDLDGALDWALHLTPHKKLPIPIQLAHNAAGAARRLAEVGG